MRGINPGEVWIIDFGMAAKVRPALLLTGEPAVDELDLVTVLLHTTALRGNRWELAIDKPFLKSGAFHLQQVQTISTVKLERRLGVLNGEEMKRARRSEKSPWHLTSLARPNPATAGCGRLGSCEMDRRRLRRRLQIT